MTLCTLTAL